MADSCCAAETRSMHFSPSFSLPGWDRKDEGSGLGSSARRLSAVIWPSLQRVALMVTSLLRSRVVRSMEHGFGRSTGGPSNGDRTREMGPSLRTAAPHTDSGHDNDSTSISPLL